MLTYAGYVVPFGVDLPVVLLGHRQLGVTWQLLMMDLEANAVAGLINNTLFYEVGRGRPSTPDCAVNPHYDEFCNKGSSSSFPSGHALLVATGAGLTCAHHLYLPIYGTPAADAAACAVMSAVTVATAVTRVMADRHYASDALAGIAIGFGTGFGLPWLLHYRGGGAAAEARAAEAPRFTLVPFGGRAQAGLGVVGVL